MKKLYVLWLIVFVIIIYMTMFLNASKTIFYGISDSKEIEISEDKSVIIDSIFVVSGETVSKGQLLIKLKSKQLNMAISQKQDKLQEFEVKKQLGKSDINSQIIQLKQEKLMKINEINQKIRSLNDKYNRNKKFTSQLKSLSIKKNPKGNSPILKNIENLNQDKSFVERNYNLKINQLKNAIGNGKNPNIILIKNIKREIIELEKQKNSLNIYSQINGVIGSVNYKAQSTVPPYSTIVTISKKFPSYIKGYIHENIYNKVSIGDKIVANSIASNYSIQGKVVGVSPRIVEFPERLNKIKNIKIWGREITIKIPENNSFLLGEKLSITVKSQ